MSNSRYSQVSRRAFLGGVSLAALTGLAACAEDSNSASPASSPATTQPTETSSAPTASSAATGAAGSLPATASATVSFTYAASGGGMVKNPYYAVWVEDADGNLVKTLMLCHLAGGQDRWLNSLTAWYAASGGTDTTTEGTKPAGSYDCTWDCTDSSGNRVAPGTYNFCVEAAVEHGNEVVVAGKQTLGSKALDADLGTSGELTSVHVKYTA